ncbi:MAG TPA: diacylglycerol kinase [Clostridiales bacterium]|jgi:YegS/Rv2252/BmrU family lipid kinase|nr:diacylglycerol kinase [Clostridiales bacterium]HBR08241.1 diacylglycerol kinase [Clostridiales bacterium]
MQKLMLLVNPVAGRSSYKQGLGEALNVLYGGGYLPTVYFTTKAGEAVLLAERHGADYDVVCCVGGDGTLSDVVAGLMRIPSPPPVGYFPLGTANDVANTLKLPKGDLVGAAKLLVNGTPMDWDVGALGSSDYFTYVAAFGAFTDVSYETSQQKKAALGQLAYLLEGMSRLPRLPHYRARVELDGHVLENDYIFGGVTNSTSVAGLVRLDQRTVRLDDGKFEVALVKNPGSLQALNVLISEVLTQNYRGEYFEIRQASRVRFTFTEPVPLTRDGENGGVYRDVTLENIPRAIKIIV